MNLELRQYRLAPLITVTVAAMVFAVLLILVRLQWAPLESADHGAAAVILAIRRRWRLAAYLIVTGAGVLVLDPSLKSLVGRLRPVVAHPIAHGNGNSFPSGHSLGSIVCYGAILLFSCPLPAARCPLPAAGGGPPCHRDRRADRADRDQPDPARRALPLRRPGRLRDRHHPSRFSPSPGTGGRSSSWPPSCPGN